MDVEIARLRVAEGRRRGRRDGEPRGGAREDSQDGRRRDRRGGDEDGQGATGVRAVGCARGAPPDAEDDEDLESDEALGFGKSRRVIDRESDYSSAG